MSSKKQVKKNKVINSVTLDKTQLTELLEQAYSSGFCEGRRAEMEEHRDLKDLLNDVEEVHGKLI